MSELHPPQQWPTPAGTTGDTSLRSQALHSMTTYFYESCRSQVPRDRMHPSSGAQMCHGAEAIGAATCPQCPLDGRRRRRYPSGIMASRASRIKIGNQRRLCGVVFLALSGVIGYFSYAEAVHITPSIISAYEKMDLQEALRDLPLLVGLLLSGLITLVGAGLTIFCFFFGLKCFVPPAVPTNTPKPYRNQPQIPELLRNGEIRTFYIPGSKVLKLLKKLFPNVRHSTKVAKRIIISDFGFIPKAIFLAGLLIGVSNYRAGILSAIDSLGVNASSVLIPSLAPLVWVILVVLCARVAGAAPLIRLRKPEARALMSSSEYAFEGHPNTIYSAVQKAAEGMRRGELDNRIHIDDTKLVPAGVTEDGTFKGTMLIESQPLYIRSGGGPAAMILLICGAALVACSFLYYFGLDYNEDPMKALSFAKIELPIYVRDVMVFVCGLLWGRLILLQSISLFSHYNYSSVMVSAEFTGSYTLQPSQSEAGTQKGAAKFGSRTETVFRGARAISESYHTWGPRELVSFAPTDGTDELLEKIRLAAGENLNTQAV